MLREKKLDFIKNRVILTVMLSIVLSTASACLSDIPYSYKKAAVVTTIYLIPMYFTLSILSNKICKQRSLVYCIRRAIKIMCIIQLIWIPIQYLMYKLLGIDINQKIFVDFFHCVENASFVRSWKWYPSGLSWHSAVLAPMFVIAFVLFDNFYMRLFIIFDALICGNSTSIVGVCLCCGALLFFNLNEKKGKITYRKNKLFIFLIFALIAGAVLGKMGFFELFFEKILHIFQRIFGANKDASTEAHFAYFTDYGIVLKKSSLKQILFGYGHGCSGYPYSVLYDRYTNLASWSVECDIIDILVSRGIFGFLVYYYFLFSICVKGYKIDYRYTAIMIPVLVQGIGYNIQWDYILFIEMLMFIMIQKKVNFFDEKKDKATVFIRKRYGNGRYED